MTEIHHAPYVLPGSTAISPPPRIELGGTAQPRPVPGAHHVDGSARLSPRTAVEGSAATGAERHLAQRAHHPYRHRRPAPSPSRLPAGGTAACRPHLRGAQGRMPSARHVEGRGRYGVAPVLVRGAVRGTHP